VVVLVEQLPLLIPLPLRLNRPQKPNLLKRAKNRRQKKHLRCNQITTTTMGTATTINPTSLTMLGVPVVPEAKALPLSE